MTTDSWWYRTSETRRLAMLIGLQRALLDDGHTDPEEAFDYAVRQAFIKQPHDIGVAIPDHLSEIRLTRRGMEYTLAWAQRVHAAGLGNVDLFGRDA